MILKFWYVKQGDFVKEMEIPEEIELKQRLSFLRYVAHPEGNGLKAVKWVFVRIGKREYEFDHVEDVK